jgi:hypothetical protein
MTTECVPIIRRFLDLYRIAVVNDKKDKNEEKIDQKEDQKVAKVEVTDSKAKEAPDERPLIDRIAAALEVFETDAVAKVIFLFPVRWLHSNIPKKEYLIFSLHR